MSDMAVLHSWCLVTWPRSLLVLSTRSQLPLKHTDPHHHYHHYKMPSFKETVEAQVAKTPVVVYSKSYCPYCTETKNLLNELGVKYDVVELDVIADGEALQDAVEDITGQGTVPNTFIGGKSVGGNSKLQKLHKKGELEPLLKQAVAL